MAGSAKQLLDEFNRNVPKLTKALPEASSAFLMKFMPAVLKDGALTVREKELVALGTAITCQCDYCIAIHVKKALEAGVTKEEIAEVCGVAILMGGGPAMTYSTMVMNAVEEFGG